MSRIGKKLISVPVGVEVMLSGQEVVVKGKKGELKHTCNDGITVTYNKDENSINVTRIDESRQGSAMHGLNRSLIANMVQGVSEGWKKNLEIVGTGYRSQLKGKVLGLTLGHSHPVNFDIPDGITITVKENTNIEVSGCDKQLVGQTAANIRSYKKPDAYKGKGIRYANEVIVLKEGKSAGK